MSTPSEPETLLIEWHIHLLREDPSKAAVIASLTVFAAGVGWLIFHHLAYSLVGAFMVISASTEYLFPIHHKITNRHAITNYAMARFEIAWVDVKRILSTDEAVRFSPLVKPSRLDSTRGVLVRFAAEGEPGNRDEVLEAAKRLVSGTAEGPVSDV